MKIRQYLLHLLLIVLFSFYTFVPSYAFEDPAIRLRTLQTSFRDGQAAFYNQNYPEAEQDFSIAAENAKALGNNKYYAISYSYLGFSQIYLDKLEEAKKTLEQADQYAFGVPVAKMLSLLAYIELYSRRGDIATEQKYIQATLVEGDEALQSIGITKEPLLQLYKSNQVLEKTISELSVSSQAQNYINDALFNGKVMHWNNETKFIKIYIAPGTHIPGWNPEYADNFKKACGVWQEILNNKIQFEFVENPNDADTIVTWNFDKSIRPAITDYNTLENKLVKADIAFHLIDNSNQLYVPRTIYKLSLHELGHLLGISGHSRNPDDIMFPARTYAMKPSARDVATLQELYARPAQITNPKGKNLVQYRQEVLAQGKHPIQLPSHF